MKVLKAYLKNVGIVVVIFAAVAAVFYMFVGLGMLLNYIGQVCTENEIRVIVVTFIGLALAGLVTLFELTPAPHNDNVQNRLNG